MRKDLNYEPDRPLMRLEPGDEAIISVTHFPERIVRKNDKEKYGGIPNGKYIAKVIRPFYLHCEDYPALSGAYNMWRGDKHGCSDGIYADENKDLEESSVEENTRKYVIACNEHSGNWPGALLFWGSRTPDYDSRSFGGYTSDIDNCEIYSESDVKEKGYHLPKYHEGMTWEEFRKYDDILIEPECLEKLGYKQMRVWYKP